MKMIKWIEICPDLQVSRTILAKLRTQIFRLASHEDDEGSRWTNWDFFPRNYLTVTSSAS
jgi:hypothetical protein